MVTVLQKGNTLQVIPFLFALFIVVELHVLQYIRITVSCYSAIYVCSEWTSEKNGHETEADNLEKHFLSG